MLANKTVVVLVMIAISSQFMEGVFINKNIPVDDWYQDGDLLLGALISIYRSAYKNFCGGGVFPAYIQISHSIKYAIDEINRDQNLLPNVTLGFVMLNYCSRSSIALARTTEFLPRAKSCQSQKCGRPPVNWTTNVDEYGLPNYDVIGVIGTSGSGSSKLVTSLLEVYKIPLISYIATSVDLAYAVKQGYFARTVPPDNFQSKAMVDIIGHFGWSYISIIKNEGSYATAGVKEVKIQIKKLGICIAYEGLIDSEEADEVFDKQVAKLNENQEARVVILYIQNVKRLFEAVIRAGLQDKFIFLCTDTFSAAVYKGLEENMPAVISTRPRSVQVKGFQEYYDTIPPWRPKYGHPWYGQYEIEDCYKRSNSCSEYNTSSQVPGFYWSVYYAKAMDVVRIFAEAAHNYIEDNCQSLTDKYSLTTCINNGDFMKYIRNVSTEGYSQYLEFDDNNEIVSSYDVIFFGKHSSGKKASTVIGEWSNSKTKLQLNESMITWDMAEGVLMVNGTPESVCAKPCSAGQFRVNGEVPCCWECHQCRDNEYVEGDLKGCERCPELYWPSEERTACTPITPVFMHWSDTLAISLATLSGIGLCGTVFITGVFIAYRDKKVIRGSNRDLMIPIIMGLYMCYLTVFAYLTKPNDYACYINYFGFHLSCTLIFCPLFLKTLRMYRIFKASANCEKRIIMASVRSQIGATFTCLLCQIAILVTLAILYPPRAVLQMPVLTVKQVELLCNLPLISLLVPLGVNLLLLLLCAVFGFLTRKLPENFNESWYIFISVSTTLFIWVAFLSTFFLAFYAYHKSALLALALFLNATVTALCLFAPKIYAVYFIDDKAIKTTNFDASTFSKDSSPNTSVYRADVTDTNKGDQ